MHSQASADIAGQAVKAVQAVKLECICRKKEPTLEFSPLQN